jgi:hypothetical protein
MPARFKFKNGGGAEGVPGKLALTPWPVGTSYELSTEAVLIALGKQVLPTSHSCLGRDYARRMRHSCVSSHAAPHSI